MHMNVMQEATDVLEQLLGDIKGKFADISQQKGVFDSLQAFTAAVNWKVRLPQSWIDRVQDTAAAQCHGLIDPLRFAGTLAYSSP